MKIYQSAEIAKQINRLRAGFRKTPYSEVKRIYAARMLELVKGDEVATAITKKFLLDNQ